MIKIPKKMAEIGQKQIIFSNFFVILNNYYFLQTKVFANDYYYYLSESFRINTLSILSFLVTINK